MIPLISILEYMCMVDLYYTSFVALTLTGLIFTKGLELLYLDSMLNQKDNMQAFEALAERGF